MESKILVIGLACTLLVSGSALADAGDRIEQRLDHRGDIIEGRLDRKGDRIDDRLDRFQ